MSFREKVLLYFEEHGIEVKRVEQDGESDSIVLHVNQSDNIKIANLRETMEATLDAAVVQSGSFGMNVVIVESTDLED